MRDQHCKCVSEWIHYSTGFRDERAQWGKKRKGEKDYFSLSVI
jgi:hypothetical protein